MNQNGRLYRWLLTPLERAARRATRQQSLEHLFHTQIQIFFFVVYSVFALVWSFIEIYLGSLFVALVFIGCQSLLTGSFVIAWRWRRLAVFTHFLVFNILVVVAVASYYTGGLRDANVTSFIFVMVAAPCALGRRGLIWTGATLLTALGFQSAHFAGYAFPNQVPPDKLLMDTFFTWSSAALGVFFVLLSYEWVRVSTWNALKQSESALRKKEAALLRSQKLETVGRLAGGIAHDFNNLLNIVMGYATVVQKETDRNPVLSEDVNAIIDAARRGAKLTEQLLTFSKRQALKARPVDLNLIVTDTCKMMRRLFGERITIETDLFSSLHISLLDVGQMEQVIMNLAVNAKQAMPEGGTLRIKTLNGFGVIDADESTAPVGAVILRITDTGVGIPEELVETIFDPFFTTKETGSGLGLSVVAGVVAQHNGRIEVESRPGRGTTFTVILPAVDKAVLKRDSVDDFEGSLQGQGEHVLVVEDEPYIRKLVEKQLKEHGYEVQAVEDGERALKVLAEEATVGLLFSDIILPGISGVELAVEAKKQRPGLQVLLTSGHADAHAGDLKDDKGNEIPLLRKPYEPEVLLRRLREILTDSL